MTEVIVAAAVALWILHDVAVIVVFRRRERWLAAHNYIQGYAAGVKHQRDGFVVITPPHGIDDLEVFKRAFRS